MSSGRKYAIGALLVLFILFPFLFYSTEVSTRYELSFAERLVHAFVSPIYDTGAYLMFALKKGAQNYTELYEAKKELARTTEEIARLRVENNVLQSLADENMRLRKLLNLVAPYQLKFKACNIIGADPSFIYKNIRINCGTDDHVMPGMGAVAVSGVVGVVMQATRHTANVLLITDINSNLDVMVARTRRRGILTGTGQNFLTLKHISKGSAILVGDEIITSGLIGAFPAGIPVGKVQHVDYNQDLTSASEIVKITPTVNLEDIQELLILQTSQHEFNFMQNFQKE